MHAVLDDDGGHLFSECGLLLGELLRREVRLHGQRRDLFDGRRLLLRELLAGRLPVRDERQRVLRERALLLGGVLRRELPVSEDQRHTGGRKARRISPLPFGAVFPMLLAGCTWRAGMTQAAADAFAKSHAGCQAVVRERSDLETGYMAHSDPEHPEVQPWRGMYEVTGCNGSAIYACSPAQTTHHGTEYPVECSPSATSGAGR